jgi:hypothetical protein
MVLQQGVWVATQVLLPLLLLLLVWLLLLLGLGLRCTQPLLLRY